MTTANVTATMKGRYYIDSGRKLATEKQIAFVRRLAAERGIEFLTDGTDVTDGQALQELPRDVVSAQIDMLLAMPKPAPEPQAAPEPVDGLDLTGLHGGYYAATIDGVTKFFRIDKPDDGKWAGWVFVKIQASADLHRQGSQKPGSAYRGASEDYLRAIASDEEAAFALYGHELGRCGVCGRTLTDEISRERGIGPVCAERIGLA